MPEAPGPPACPGPSGRRGPREAAGVLAAAALAASALAGGSASAASLATWDKLAECESGGNWSINTGNGYYGGIQFSLSTWQSMGGTQYAAYPHQATREEQITVGEKLLDAAGEGQWPHCGPRVGLGSDPADPFPTTPPMAAGMSPIVGVGDINRTGVADFVARGSDGRLYSYMGKGDGTFTGRTDLGGGWNQYDMVIGVGDINKTGVPDLLARGTDGRLYSYMGKGDGTFTGRTDLGGGWNKYNLIVGAGDINSTGVADLIARDANGDLWAHMGVGDGTFTGPTKIGHGWNQYDTIVGVGDINKTGVPDLLARNKATGHLYSYMGIGDGTLSGRTDLGAGWDQYTAITGPGDINSTGVADLIARDGSGDLYTYMGIGDGKFTGRTKAGHGYNIYS
ncbi:transglycosylase family protein [Streptomyces clavuligerus]|uniref:transglycosylase family protein n=1 Tax=Streptomyces clavuligerus TaxID=1901 RepID=UPI0018D19093|nr:transglycosylase family protein [Streptomyces clavuligerus]